MLYKFRDLFQYHRKYIYNNITYYTFITRILHLVLKIKNSTDIKHTIAIYLPNCYNYLEILLASIISGRNIIHWNHYSNKTSEIINTESIHIIFTCVEFKRYFTSHKTIIIIDENVKNIPFPDSDILETQITNLEKLNVLNKGLQIFTIDSHQVQYNQHHLKYFLKHTKNKTPDTLLAIPLHNPLGCFWCLKIIFSGKRIFFGKNMNNLKKRIKNVVCMYPYNSLFQNLSSPMICYLPNLHENYQLSNIHKVSYRYFYFPVGIELFYNISFKKYQNATIKFTTQLSKSIMYDSYKKLKINPKLIKYLGITRGKIIFNKINLRKNKESIEISYNPKLKAPVLENLPNKNIHLLKNTITNKYYKLFLYIYGGLITNQEIDEIYQEAVVCFPHLTKSQPIFLEEGKMMKDVVYRLLNDTENITFRLIIQRTNNIYKNRISIILPNKIKKYREILTYFNVAFKVVKNIIYQPLKEINNIPNTVKYIANYILYIFHILINMYYQMCNHIISIKNISEDTSYFYNEIIPEDVLQKLPKNNVKSTIIFTLLQSIKKYCPEILVYNLDTDMILPLPLIENSIKGLQSYYLDFYEQLSYSNNSKVSKIITSFSKQLSQSLSQNIIYINVDYSNKSNYYSYTFGKRGISYIDLSLHKNSLYISIFIRNLGYKIILKKVIEEFIIKLKNIH